MKRLGLESIKLTGRQLLSDFGVSKVDWTTTFDFVEKLDHQKGNRSHEGAALLTIHSVEFKGFVASNFVGYVTKFTPHKDLKLIASGKLTFDERVVLHCVGSGLRMP